MRKNDIFFVLYQKIFHVIKNHFFYILLKIIFTNQIGATTVTSTYEVSADGDERKEWKIMNVECYDFHLDHNRPETSGSELNIAK